MRPSPGESKQKNLATSRSSFAACAAYDFFRADGFGMMRRRCTCIGVPSKPQAARSTFDFDDLWGEHGQAFCQQARRIFCPGASDPCQSKRGHLEAWFRACALFLNRLVKQNVKDYEGQIMIRSVTN